MKKLVLSVIAGAALVAPIALSAAPVQAAEIKGVVSSPTQEKAGSDKVCKATFAPSNSNDKFSILFSPSEGRAWDFPSKACGNQKGNASIVFNGDLKKGKTNSVVVWFTIL